MSFVIVWEASAKFDRSVPRSTFANHYWSANKVNFDENQMSQSHQGLFDGRLAILEFLEEIKYPPFGKISDSWWLSEVMDAFYMGTIFPDIIRQHKEVLIMGSVGPINSAPECDILKFCPSLFVFSDDKEANISLGIERLTFKDNVWVIPVGTKVLAMRDIQGKPYTEELKHAFQAHWKGMDGSLWLERSASEIFFNELAARIGKTSKEVADDLNLR